MATLREVAEMAGVSSTTASRILTGDPTFSVPEDTRQRVLKASLIMNYQVRSKRKEVAFGRYNLKRVGIIAYRSEQLEIEDPYFFPIRISIEQELKDIGFETVAVQWQETMQSFDEFQDLDGIIVIGNNRNAARHFKDKPQRVIFVDQCPDMHAYSSVVVDFHAATRMVLDHLLQSGHKSIGYIGGIQDMGREVDRRLQSLQEYLASKSLFYDQHIYIANEWSVLGGYEMARQSLERGPLADAYFVASDQMAIGAMRAWTEAGLSVPKDVAIVGFDDIGLAAYVNPPLTTVSIPTNVMGRLAAHLLVDGIGDVDSTISINVPSTLIVRESCGFHPQKDLVYQ